MIDLKTVALELAQAREVRIAAELAGCEVEELADSLRQANEARLRPREHRRAAAPRLIVFSP